MNCLSALHNRTLFHARQAGDSTKSPRHPLRTTGFIVHHFSLAGDCTKSPPFTLEQWAGAHSSYPRHLCQVFAQPGAHAFTLARLCSTGAHAFTRAHLCSTGGRSLPYAFHPIPPCDIHAASPKSWSHSATPQLALVSPCDYTFFLIEGQSAMLQMSSTLCLFILCIGRGLGYPVDLPTRYTPLKMPSKHPSAFALTITSIGWPVKLVSRPVG